MKMKVTSLALICLVALAFVSSSVAALYADPVEPNGNGNPHKKSGTITPDGNGNPHKKNATITPDGNGNPHKK